MKKRALKIILWVVSIIILLVLIGVVVKIYGKNKCKDVQVTIHAPRDCVFLTEEDVASYLSESGNQIIGSELSRVDIEKLESIINKKPYVLSSKVYMSLTGILNVDVIQRTPIARVQPDVRLQHISSLDYAPFYISSDGGLMPLTPDKTARVIFVSGNIRNLYNNFIKLDVDSACVAQDTLSYFKTLYSIFDVATYIDQDEFLKAQIQQIYVDDKGELILIPEVGKHIVIFGDGNEIAKKFRRLEIFYEKAAFFKGWEKYDTINVKYNNQIICS